jgi:3-isopropylmalate/(R)-2-methylmalate dehydratase small subunit
MTPMVPVRVQAALSESLDIYLRGLGTVTAFNTVTVRSRVQGELMEVLFKEGESVKAGDVLVAGPNFGIGSSREQAAGALKQLGIQAVIAPSFSGLFFRNAFNLGLLLLTCPEAESLQENEQLQLDLKDTPEVKTGQGQILKCHSVPSFLMDMVREGGLVNVLKQRMAARALSKLV